MDCFHIIGVITLIAAPLVLLTKNCQTRIQVQAPLTDTTRIGYAL